ncbi:oxygen tolerance family protein, partial [Vibrio parahaemolyticus V-223/04]
IVTD